jgi:hypothetical protein
MAYTEAWVSYGTDERSLIYPKDVEDFTDYMIARFLVRQVVSGARGAIQTGHSIVIKGKIISIHPGYRYLLRFKKVQRTDHGDEYELLAEAGFREAEQLPWTWETLRWTLQYEVRVKNVEAAILGVFHAMSELVGNDPEIDAEDVRGPPLEEALAKQPWYQEMVSRSDYYKMAALCAVRDAWPSSVDAIRKLETFELRALADHLRESPHDLCYYAHSRHYKLGEMSFAALGRLQKDRGGTVTTPRVCLGAACFYDMLKQERMFAGHTVFAQQKWLDAFRRKHPEFPAEGVMQWLLRQGHLIPLDKDALYVERDLWYVDNSPIYWLAFPRDDKLKERIIGHLRRICENFRQARGAFTPRDPDGPVVATPKGPLNARQREALDHILNNPITIIQGGPGSGKTALGVEHVTCIFQNVAVYTHVGRQAVSLADRLGGCLENASTIHGAHHKRLKKDGALRFKYAERIEVLVIDEAYNGDDATIEWALALPQNATHVVLVGDPDQILPIAGEEGAGTPVLDIARAFPQHVIVLNENMRQLESARAIHDVVSCVRIKQPQAINWSPPSGAVTRVDPPAGNTESALAPLIETMVRRLRRGVKFPSDEHNWQIVTFFNGFKPDEQGLGVIQINHIVERYMERENSQQIRRAVQVTRNLRMYPGFKFMINEKYEPHKSLKPGGGGKKGKKAPTPAAAARARKKVVDGGTIYSETRNGQIEVVKALRQVHLKDRKGGPYWMVECEPKGRCVQGAKLLINRKLHVDPSGIVPAWAITSNKSMGGECTNVGVFVPQGIQRSYFDRSNLYVAFSRPIEYLGVIGRLPDIAHLVQRDPRTVITGLSLRLRVAAVRAPHQTPVGWDWKDQHDAVVYGMLNAETLATFADIYNQSRREVYDRPTPLCGLSWAAFSAAEELDLNTRPAARRELQHLLARIRHKLYAGIPDHSPDVPARWEVVPVAVPLPDQREDDESPDLEDVGGGEEPVAKRGRVEKEEILSESL